MKKDYRELYEKITESDWFKKAYHNKSLGECPIVVEELEESEDEKIRKSLIKDFRNYYEMYDKSCGEPKWGSDCLLVKDILAWFEKQKEHKPNIELIQRSWYMQGYYDGKYSREPKWIIKTGEGGPKHELNPRYGEPLVEEQKPLSTEETELNSIAFLEQLGYTCVPPRKEQKPTNDKAFEEWIDGWYNEHCSPQHNAIIMTEKAFKNWSRGIRNMYAEQKPAEWTLPKDFEEAVYKVANFISPFDSQEELRKVSHRFAEQLLSLAKKELDKPAEWSEEDEAHRTFILESLEDQIRFCKKDAEGAYYAKQIRTAQNWLKSLPERFNPQPKQEWSEEDKKILNDIVVFVSGYADKRVVSRWVEYLKSLRPQPKQELSIEKAIQWFEDTFYFQNNSSGRGEDYEITTHDFDSLEEMYDSFRKAVSVDLQPHWKPSKEQIEALFTASERNDKLGSILNSLYRDLKKL